MNVIEIMTPQVSCIGVGDSVFDAARRMKETDAGVLPVTSPEGVVVGVLTDRDIVVRALAESADLAGVRVDDIMTPNPITCRPDCPLDAAARTMRERQIRRLIVTEEHNRNVVGIVSLGDIAVRSHENELVGQATEGICHP